RATMAAVDTDSVTTSRSSTVASAVEPAVPPRCSLILPIDAELSAEALLAAVEVLVRTAPEGLDLDLVLAVDRAPAGTAEVIASRDGDARVVPGTVAVAAMAVDSETVAVVDPVTRPDLALLPELVARLRRQDDPLPFVQRLGILVAEREKLAALPTPPNTI